MGYICGGRKIAETLNYEPAFYKYTQLSPTSANSIYQEPDFKLFPNPATRQFKVQSVDFKVEDATIEIYDLTGKKLIEKNFPAKSENIEIDVSSLFIGF